MVNADGEERMKTFARAILIASGFLELSDDSAVDPDAAVAAMEAIAAELQGATAEERAALKQAAAEMARRERGKARAFYASFVDAIGLEDSPPPPPKGTGAGKVSAGQKALDREVRQYHGDVGVVRRLLAKDPSLVNVVLDREGYTPLHVAALYGRVAIARAPIKAGADLDRRSRYGGTPLHTAACAGQSKVGKVLLDAGADPMAKDRDGRTPLEDAKLSGTEELVKLLRARGRKP